MKFLNELPQKLNDKQKKIVGISVAAILLVFTLGVASNIGFRSNAFDWKRTWIVWLIFIGLVSYFEYKLFS